MGLSLKPVCSSCTGTHSVFADLMYRLQFHTFVTISHYAGELLNIAVTYDREYMVQSSLQLIAIMIAAFIIVATE